MYDCVMFQYMYTNCTVQINAINISPLFTLPYDWNAGVPFFHLLIKYVVDCGLLSPSLYWVTFKTFSFDLTDLLLILQILPNPKL